MCRANSHKANYSNNNNNNAYSIFSSCPSSNFELYSMHVQWNSEFEVFLGAFVIKTDCA
jgi:hypothetical protein